MIAADVFSAWRCVNTHLNAPQQQTANTCWWLVNSVYFIKRTRLLFTLLILMEAVMVYLVFHMVLVHFGLILVK